MRNQKRLLDKVVLGCKQSVIKHETVNCFALKRRIVMMICDAGNHF